MNITKEQLEDYLKATGGKRSYLVAEWQKTRLLKVEEFIYISDHLKELKEKWKEY